MKRYLVYFWETEDQQSVKIGHCQGNLYTRGQGIKTGNHTPMCGYPTGVIVCEDKGDMIKTEKALHRQFKAQRAHGEWFNITPEISGYIQEFTDTESGKAFVEEGRERKREYNRERSQDPEYRERRRERSQDPEYRESQREYRNDPENRERQKKRSREYNRKRYQNDPEYRERQKKLQRERSQDPEYKKRKREHNRKRYQNDPEVREYHREYNARPKNKERQQEYQREYNARKKRKKQPINGQQLTFLE